MIQQRPRNPIIPGSSTDRTGSMGILRRAAREINRRFDGLLEQVLAAFARIPVYTANDASSPLSLYGMTPAQMEALAAELQAAADYWIASSSEKASMFWWSPYVAETAQLGTAQSVANITNLSPPSYAARRTLASVIFSEPYRNRVGIGQVKSYEHWTGQAAAVRSELAQIIGSSVASGKSPDAVTTLIRDRLGVSKAKAKQFAQTDITDTLRQARWAERDQAAEEFGLNIGLLWTSAFLPTTRPWHASRHGGVFTSLEVRKFYDAKGNRYACHCGQTECLLDDDNQPILTASLKKKMKDEREAWEEANKKKKQPS